MNKDIKRFLSIDKIYSTYENTKNFKKIFGVTRKAKVGGLEPGKKKDKIDLICLAGFMKILTSNFIKRFKGKIINMHPSLLPKYKGLNTHQRAIDNNENFSGCTVHYVNSKLDSGKIILQDKVKILKTDTNNKLTKRVLKQEHLLYPKALKKVLTSL